MANHAWQHFTRWPGSTFSASQAKLYEQETARSTGHPDRLPEPRLHRSRRPRDPLERASDLLYIHKVFSWDSAKAASNLAKHGISFEEAATVFTDFDGLDWEDLGHSGSEPRSKRLGKTLIGRIVLVVYTKRRTQDEKETIRIISARHASQKERKAYSR